ncbi:isoprenylcysteine carboxylmethyltransferase family protein [Anaerolinea sp.]|uniref:methyltransferase family protein n=1 Tax=Anaerolinea sp. TaxID=1872519 RepID=UPI002ACED051|nr:isoprenylcysteine carboxylmethyltransferase family protein [Anaerolinea sp.]
MDIPSGFWLTLLACAGYGAIHSALASHTVKGWAERRFGQFARRTYRLFFVLMASLTTLALLAVPLLLPDRPLYVIPFPWIILTLAVQAFAVWGLLAALSQTDALAFLGLRQLSAPEPLRRRAKSGELITRGFYGRVRHPLYLFSLILLWLFPVVTWNILALMIGLTVYLYIGTLLEERKLLDEFGEAYAEYRRTTPMIFPRLLPGRVTRPRQEGE